MRALLDLVLPQRCVACGDLGEQLCKSCLTRLRRIAPPLCARCGAPTAWPVARCRECAGRRIAFESARAAVEYDAAVKAFVSAWKERGLRGLGRLAAELVAETIPPADVAVLTFIPPDGDRSVRRGHHPAERLARELGERWGLPVRTLLSRRRHLRPQRGLTLPERRRNVRDAFRTIRSPPPGVVIVDDVYTTGSTVGAAASALRQAGVRRVSVITFARAVR